MSRPFPKLFIGLAVALLLAEAPAQTTSSTPAIGFYKFNVPQGQSAWSCAFVAKVEFQGQASAMPTVSGQTMTITQTGAGWTVDQFNEFPGSHYIEILENGGRADEVGWILDIVGNQAASIGVTVPSGYTLPASGSFRYLVRKHATLGSVFPNGNGLGAGEDLIQIYKPALVSGDLVDLETNGLYLGDGNWGDINDPEGISLNNFVIKPCQGFVLYTAVPRNNVVMGGGAISYVKNGATQIQVNATFTNYVGGMNPLVALNPSSPAPSDTIPMSSSGLFSLAPGDDVMTLPSIDGFMVDLSLFIHDGSTIYDYYSADPEASQNATEIANGRAFSVFPAVDDRLIIPQTHP